MPQAFIIMQIGNLALDDMCSQVIVPALTVCGLDPKRVDKHNKGGLLKSEITDFIKSSEIIVADLTNERPNCYLEVGYAMGSGKLQNLILMAREDHLAESPNHEQGGSKVHFDLSGYDILFWSPDKLDEARLELEKRIRRRQAGLDAPLPTAPWNEEALQKIRGQAIDAAKEYGAKGIFEVQFAPVRAQTLGDQKQIYEAARTSEIETWGWPIGVFIEQRPEFRPKILGNGIECEVKGDKFYDYWRLSTDGAFYLLESLFEDTVATDSFFFNTQIVRCTEAMLYCLNLYSKLGLDSTARIQLTVRYSGLQGRKIGAAGQRLIFRSYVSSEDSVESTIQFALADLPQALPTLTKDLLRPIFLLFELFEVSDDVYEEIVTDFQNGKIG